MKKILLAEDNRSLSENIAEMLELANYEVIVAENGDDAINKAIQHLPDIILCDIMMPVFNGYQVFKCLKLHPDTRGIIFIYFSASTERKDVGRCLSEGADGYICKPFTEKDLFDTIDECVKKRVVRANWSLL